MKYTEREIQDWLCKYFMAKQRKVTIPNMYLYEWESDLISVTKSGYVHEYEIKVTKADYKNDFKNKIRRHESLRHGHRTPDYNQQYWIDQARNSGASENTGILKKVTVENRIITNRPNYFFYVCPEDIITEVPEYAGLIHCKPYLKIVKKAPLLHKEIITGMMEAKIMRSFYYKYWVLRGLHANK